ncbi:Aste57867_13323 [Aphanomyces stellatus]|uniref:Aste57867_13323 protein n=1 Tax=Aphanomyces stellatus TaxID=120398 RepID=A0A485KZV8_9STRA|nr:hypothetical protein As57867_013274 [Aphanomyces stellatus]VFT90162.1 Aste57867_13323 [Aphanomyces stellatus]
MKEGCLQCCSGLSAVGVVFLSAMSIILSKQPQYIRGFHHDHAPHAHSSCAVAAVLYAVTFAGCTYALRQLNAAKLSKYGVKVVSSDEFDPLQKTNASADDDEADYKVRQVGGGVISALKSQLKNAKVMHSDEMHSLIQGDGNSSPRKPKPRKGD